ncbi:MAG TPA: VWA domain-containing protein [Verrucomicrobiae bacterium]|jgi:Ca-activated chloride channel family protein|nr:VWA domain-containing protein [Verrucomicrobiae bacterium]
MTGEFEFQYPWVLALLALLPVYALLHGRFGTWSALQFSSAEIARAAGARMRTAAGRLLAFLRLLAVGLGIIALAGPRLANYHVVTETPGIDIMLVLDLSWSMVAVDMAPEERLSRFAIASGVLQDFIQKRPNDRIGLIGFSGKPYLVSPLTMNHDWLIQNLGRLHIGIIRDLGTAIGDAVAVGAKRLQAVPNGKSRIMILLTDGDNNLGQVNPLAAAQLAAALGIKVYTIGIGIEQPCNMPEFDPQTGQFRLDANGNLIPSYLLQPANYSVLDTMANLSGGQFYRATNQRQLQNIYDQINRLEKSRVTRRRFAEYHPLFEWPLLACLGVLALELILANTRLRRVP